jgi:hypothetical protein
MHWQVLHLVQDNYLIFEWNVMLDEVDDGWLDEQAENFGSATLLEAETSSFLDLNSKHLTTFLADTKYKASNYTVTTSTTGSQGPKKSSQSVYADDNDFSIYFD